MSKIRLDLKTARIELERLENLAIDAKTNYDICKAKVEETQSHMAYAALKSALDKWEQATINLESAQSEYLKMRDNGSNQ